MIDMMLDPTCGRTCTVVNWSPMLLYVVDQSHTF